MIIEFDAEVWQWDAREDSSWYFVSVPRELSDDIREIPRPTRGFGSVRVRATIGGSTWASSIFPSAKEGTYALPLKKAVRDAEGLFLGDLARVRLEIVDA
jgi:hypothetical protein